MRAERDAAEGDGADVAPPRGVQSADGFEQQAEIVEHGCRDVQRSALAQHVRRRLVPVDVVPVPRRRRVTVEAVHARLLLRERRLDVFVGSRYHSPEMFERHAVLIPRQVHVPGRARHRREVRDVRRPRGSPPVAAR